MELLMPTIVVEVMPKAELLDPQGKAVAGALARLGKTGFTGVRIGKRFEITVDGPVTDAVLGEVRLLADEMFSNSVIEDVVGISVDGTSVDGPAVDGETIVVHGVAGETH
jgi:phosphoribosylformylglycinamidine synthase